jgi:hypothetical protein
MTNPKLNTKSKRNLINMRIQALDNKILNSRNPSQIRALTLKKQLLIKKMRGISWEQ